MEKLCTYLPYLMFFLSWLTNVLRNFRKFIKYVKKFGKIEEKPCCLTSLNHFFTNLIYLPENQNLVIDFITNRWCKQTQQKFCQAYCKSGLGHLGKNWLKRTSEERAGLAKKIQTSGKILEALVASDLGK